MEESFANRSAFRDPLIGRVLHDRYRVEKRIGKGGMGIVYLAEHVLLRRKVALKTLSERAFASEELIARFHREATAAAAVGNEHVVGVTDMGQLEDGSYYVALEYLDGVELAYAVAADGPFPVRRAVRVILQLCEALTAVHAAGIVHRDLKPENLFLVDKNGEPDFLKVLDFGVCKARSEGRPGDAPLTHTGASLGTPQFMAPEQIENSAAVDARTDIYAAGAILYFTLTGRPPFEDSTLPRLFLRICSEPPPPLRQSRSDLPIELEAVIARAMARDPADRYPTSEALRTALEPFADANFERAETVRLPPAKGRETPTIELLPKPLITRQRIVQGAALIVLVGAAVAASAALSNGTREPSAREVRSEAQAAPTVPLDLSPAIEPEPPIAATPPAPVATSPKRAHKRAAPAAPTPPIAMRPEPEPQPEPQPEPAATAPVTPPEAERPVRPGKAYPLSQRELKDVFQ